MLRASAHGLHRCPHIAVARDKVPPRGHEAIPIDASALVQRLRRALAAIGYHLRPHEIAVAAQDQFGVEIPDDELKNLKTVKDVVVYVHGKGVSA